MISELARLCSFDASVDVTDAADVPSPSGNKSGRQDGY